MKTVIVSTPNNYPYYRQVQPLAVSRGLAITPVLTIDGVVPHRYTITHLNTGGAVVRDALTARQAKKMLAALGPIAQWKRLTLTDVMHAITHNTRLKKRIAETIQRVLPHTAE